MGHHSGNIFHLVSHGPLFGWAWNQKTPALCTSPILQYHRSTWYCRSTTAYKHCIKAQSHCTTERIPNMKNKKLRWSSVVRRQNGKKIRASQTLKSSAANIHRTLAERIQSVYRMKNECRRTLPSKKQTNTEHPPTETSAKRPTADCIKSASQPILPIQGIISSRCTCLIW